MRCLMMGTGPFAVPTFHAVCRNHQVVGLITRPLVANASRKGGPTNPMLEASRDLGVASLAPEDVNDESLHPALAELQPDVLVVCDYGQILSGATLALASLGGVNLHGSLLPRYRGAAPINWAIANGDRETGVTVIHMTQRLDAGPSLVKRTTPIGADETAPELEQRLSQIGADAVLDALEMLRGWDRVSILGEPQNQSEATRAPRLRKEQGRVDWRRPALEIRNRVRAFQPWPGAYTELPAAKAQPLRLILNRVSVVNVGEHGQVPGTVLRADGEQLVVACGQEALSLERIQPAGKRLMDASEFLRGYRIPVGQVLSAP
jgi:methionyl-tRNA formyltransferase